MCKVFIGGNAYERKGEGAGVERKSDVGLTPVTGKREGKDWIRRASAHRAMLRKSHPGQWEVAN